MLPTWLDLDNNIIIVWWLVFFVMKHGRCVYSTLDALFIYSYRHYYYRPDHLSISWVLDREFGHLFGNSFNQERLTSPWHRKELVSPWWFLSHVVTENTMHTVADIFFVLYSKKSVYLMSSERSSSNSHPENATTLSRMRDYSENR